MRRIICFVVVMFCVLAMIGCNDTLDFGSTVTNRSNTNILRDKGLELIGEVDKLAECEAYTLLHTSSDEMMDLIKDFGDNNYSEPKAVFVIENVDTVVLNSVKSEIELPTDISEMIKGKLASAFSSQINALNGAKDIAAMSIINHEDSFIYEGLKSSMIYLYTYDSNYGFMVTFTPNDENIVNFNAMPVVNSQLMRCSTAEDVIRFFNRALNIEDVSVSVLVEEK